jgi:signal transduction histidine kinase
MQQKPSPEVLTRNGTASVRQINERHVVRLLRIGFVLMVLLIVIDGLIGVHTILRIRENVSRLNENQFRTVFLIDEVQRAQATLSSVVYELYVTPQGSNRDALAREVERTGRALSEIFASIPKNDEDIAQWREVERNSLDMKADAEDLVSASPSIAKDLRDVSASREDLLSAIASLIRSNHKHASEIRAEIDRMARRQVIEDATLLSLGVLVACLCAWLVIRTARRLYRQITEQSDELDRVSWQLLEKQETLARRLSHELHDELGQSLTALKTNLSRHAASGCAEPEWIRDSSDLLRDSIRSAHEISQLLRPTILDDFGLESALNWLCERFEERNRIEVTCRCEVAGRFDEQTETHLFRIAQEALTNVARHANASRVVVELNEDGGAVVLRIADNGAGITSGSDRSRPSFGLTGMRARARSLRGEMSIDTAPGEGTQVKVSFHRMEVANAEEHPHLVS